MSHCARRISSNRPAELYSRNGNSTARYKSTRLTDLDPALCTLDHHAQTQKDRKDGGVAEGQSPALPNPSSSSCEPHRGNNDSPASPSDNCLELQQPCLKSNINKFIARCCRSKSASTIGDELRKCKYAATARAWVESIVGGS